MTPKIMWLAILISDPSVDVCALCSPDGNIPTVLRLICDCHGDAVMETMEYADKLAHGLQSGSQLYQPYVGRTTRTSHFTEKIKFVKYFE